MGGFELHKFLSDYTRLVNQLPFVDGAASMNNKSSELWFNVLGPSRTPSGALFCIVINIDSLREDFSPTKRSILSKASKLFVPLGWLPPMILSTKAFLQLWLKQDILGQ